MILTIRATTGRENVIIDSITSRVKNHNIAIKALLHPVELTGYLFIEGDMGEIEKAIKGIPHVRGIIKGEVPIEKLEPYLIPEKREVQVEVGDIISIISGPFKNEKGKVTHFDEQKKEVTIELLEAAIPIPVTISVNSVRLVEKKKSE